MEILIKGSDLAFVIFYAKERYALSIHPFISGIRLAYLRSLLQLLLTSRTNFKELCEVYSNRSFSYDLEEISDLVLLVKFHGEVS